MTSSEQRETRSKDLEKSGDIPHKNEAPELPVATVEQKEHEPSLESLHKWAGTGLAFEGYLSKQEHPNVDDFLLEYPTAELTRPMREAYDRMCGVMEKERGNAADFLAVLQEHNQENPGKVFFRQNARGHGQVGDIQVEQRGGYIVVSCANVEDYASLCSGTRSGGTYHRSVGLNIRREGFEEPAWDPTSGLPPPLIPEAWQSAQANVLLVREDAWIGKEEIIQHEQQHFINEHLFVASQRHTGDRVDPGVAYRDEAIASIRSGVPLDDFTRFLSGESYEKLFVGDVVQHANELHSALETAAKTFRSPKERAMLAHHMLLTPLEKMAPQVLRLSEFYMERKEQAAKSIERVNMITPDLVPYPPHLIPRTAEAIEANNVVNAAFREVIAKTPDVEKIAFTDMSPETTLAECARAVATYFSVRDEFLQKTGLPEQIDLVRASLPPELSS